MSRYVGLFFGAVCVLAMAVLSFTPLAWHEMGRPNESYPELVYLIFGLPLAVVMLAGGIVFAVRGPSTRWLKALQYIQWTASVLLCLAALSPWLS
ncbi:hypothetical protein P6U16_08560 [Rhizobium sp. 32-5/1]|uniref:hypothetical protein n=1 Tax=Rhizobium sp. 32-5/1 TaxID=3019602 RepID=UPI00240D4148|nr:hypothetical protein [Rhizobium sp. 32-5/1]WEZ84610.1 hypothetical protein P6U16_08560 [Rhizobium sp. 32-5/1]